MTKCMRGCGDSLIILTENLVFKCFVFNIAITKNDFIDEVINTIIGDLINVAPKFISAILLSNSCGILVVERFGNHLKTPLTSNDIQQFGKLLDILNIHQIQHNDLRPPNVVKKKDIIKIIDFQRIKYKNTNRSLEFYVKKFNDYIKKFNE